MELSNACTGGPFCREADFFDMDFQIHCIELEAYHAVLRAFHAQSDTMSWGKIGLMGELRKELRINEEEHREILENIISDPSIARDHQMGSGFPNLATVTTSSDFMSTGHCKRLKPAHTTAVLPSKFPSHAQPSALAAPMEEHDRDNQWASNTAVFSPQMRAAYGQASAIAPQHRQAPNCGKVRRSKVVQTAKKGFMHTEIENIKPDPADTEIRATEKLIHEVKKDCGGPILDPTQLQSAKPTFKARERELMKVVAKLSHAHDDYPQKSWQQRHSGEEREINARRHNTGVLSQLDGNRTNYGEDYGQLCPERAGIPCINLQDDEYDD